jgi:hypothetical protein
MKASIIKSAGIMDGKQLFAVYDEHGSTSYQIWDNIERIAKLFILI